MPKFVLGNVECNKDNDCLFGQKCRKKTNKCEYKTCNRSRDCAGNQKCRGRKCVPVCKYVFFITSCCIKLFQSDFFEIWTFFYELCILRS